jgi:hypothetical protein
MYSGLFKGATTTYIDRGYVIVIKCEIEVADGLSFQVEEIRKIKAGRYNFI